MAVLRIAKMGNPVLQRKAEPVADPTAPEIRELAADMQETLEDIGASGLAAPQVFVAKRVVVYRIIASRIPPGSGLVPRPWTVMVNPVITPRAAEKTPVWERCLSIPGLTRAIRCSSRAWLRGRCTTSACGLATLPATSGSRRTRRSGHSAT